MKQRIFGLDLLRCIAILLVVTSHTLPIISPTDLAITISIYSAVIGVEAFFVLSGFLIGSIIIRLHYREEGTSLASVKAFLIRRWFRTLPNYFLILLISIVLIFILDAEIPFSYARLISYFFFLQNSVTLETNRFFGVSWTLAIEEWFYLLFPFALLLFQKFFREKKTSLVWTILTFLIFPLALRIVLAIATDIPWDAGFRKLTFTRLDAIGAGVLAAYISHHYSEFWTKNVSMLAIMGTVVFSLLMLVFYYKFILIYNMNANETADSGLFLKTIFFTLLSFALAALIPSLIRIRANAGNLLIKAITTISLISYALYLLHPLVMMMVFISMQNKVIPQNNALAFCLIWIISLGASYVLYHVYEKRMTALRERF